VIDLASLLTRTKPLPPADCICPARPESPNPTCLPHGWWNRDPIVLDLADHPDGPWAAALEAFGDQQ
jgi:hypothetical protein